jgi:hypothetical protein
MFPANSKANPIEYDGKRTVVSMQDFLETFRESPRALPPSSAKGHGNAKVKTSSNAGANSDSDSDGLADRDSKISEENATGGYVSEVDSDSSLPGNTEDEPLEMAEHFESNFDVGLSGDADKNLDSNYDRGVVDDYDGIAESLAEAITDDAEIESDDFKWKVALD